MFRTVLIANRGEIACRVARSAEWIGIHPVVVYTEADRRAGHVTRDDDAFLVSDYLNIPEIVAAAIHAGAEAIHPGYGFLAENADFAQACADAGITFIGPSPAAIRAMGDKAAARAIMEKAGVPVVPGYHGKRQDTATLRRAADRIGYPVMIKPVAGGGGKGMRVVREPADLPEALAAAKREAKSSFGDVRLLIEKYIERPRHIEVQVFGDSRGEIVHLFERDCSVQRRHQKIIEEAPAPGVDPEYRARLCAAALAAARAVNYTNAGTVEFIAATSRDGRPGDFHFMEMNTRLQVEHPVTEMVTGVDLVEWQFHVAAGEPLPKKQDELAMSGHAVEARLYAEDPANGFLPSPGRVAYAELPESHDEIRVDDMRLRDGDTIPPNYDPMIAKIIARGENRAGAIRNLRDALDETRIAGVATNAGFLVRILGTKDFARGGVDTGFVERNLHVLLPRNDDTPQMALALACLGMFSDFRRMAVESARKTRDPWSPWARTDGWRPNDVGHTVLRFFYKGREIDIPCRFEAGGYRLELPDGTVRAALVPPGSPKYEDDQIILGETVDGEIDGELNPGIVVRDGNRLYVFTGGECWPLDIHDPLAAAEAHEGASGGLTAPMPGRIAAVHVRAGVSVRRGQPLIVVEAMKMEHTLHAPADGKVAEVRFKPGDQVSEGEVLVVVEEAGS